MIRFLAVLLILVVGCSEERKVLNRDPKLANLSDEATPQDRDDIMGALTKIEAFTKNLGAPRSFRSLPIFVTTREDLSDKGYLGLCERDNTGKGIKIILKRELIDSSRVVTEGISTPLFQALLHETGHCYFRREHECNFIEKKGLELQFKWKTHLGNERTFRFGFLPSSIMQGDCERASNIPEALESYYVGEVIGKHRAETLEQLRTFAEFEMVPPIVGRR